MAKEHIYAVPFLLLLISSCGTAAAEPLIKPDEAKAPNQNIEILGSRGLSPGPTIRLIAPASKNLNLQIIEASNVPTTFTFQLELKPHSGTTIDWNTFKVTYLKEQEILLTSRLTPYKTNTGILFSRAEVPPGTHFIKVEVSDSDKLPSSKIIKLVVSGQ